MAKAKACINCGRTIEGRLISCDKCGRYICEDCANKTETGNYCNKCFEKIKK